MRSAAPSRETLSFSNITPLTPPLLPPEIASPQIALSIPLAERSVHWALGARRIGISVLATWQMKNEDERCLGNGVAARHVPMDQVKCAAAWETKVIDVAETCVR